MLLRRFIAATYFLGQSSLGLSAASADAVGRSIFFDTSLSEPAGTSCASCHDPKHGYAGNHGSTLGVAAGSAPGKLAQRNTPSIRYLSYVPSFFFYWDDDATLPTPRGGLFWDGRANTIAAAVQQPLLNLNEMGNHDAAGIKIKIELGPYAQDFAAVYPGASQSPDATMAAIGQALAAFLTTPQMAPFSSRFDAYVRGTGTLSALEAQGLQLFDDPARGGCAVCHKIDVASHKPERSLFTDFGFDAPGPPRNAKIPANADLTYFDLGLCQRTNDPRVNEPIFCGQFRTPSLRNVGLRQYFLHNGVMSKLRDVVNFYATRDTDPWQWYPTGHKFNDLPVDEDINVNLSSVPYGQSAGETPRLSQADVDAITAFLMTLTDSDLSQL